MRDHHIDGQLLRFQAEQKQIQTSFPPTEFLQEKPIFTSEKIPRSDLLLLATVFLDTAIFCWRRKTNESSG